MLRKTPEHIPNSVCLRKETVNLESSASDARNLLTQAVEVIPLSMQLWPALAPLESMNISTAISKFPKFPKTLHGPRPNPSTRIQHRRPRLVRSRNQIPKNLLSGSSPANLKRQTGRASKPAHCSTKHVNPTRGTTSSGSKPPGRKSDPGLNPYKPKLPFYAAAGVLLLGPPMVDGTVGRTASVEENEKDGRA